MPKVLISDKMSPKAEAVFQEHGIEVDVKTGLSPDELKEIISEYDGLAIRSASKVTEDIINAATNLKVVGRAGIGVDNVDIPTASQKGIIVMNTPFGNTVTTAEHAVSLMVSAARNIPQASAALKQGRWEKTKWGGVELYQKTLGVIGTGNIGSLVIERAHGLKMRVIAYDPFISQERADDLGVELVELDELFRRADFMTIHTPLTNATKHLVNDDAFDQMKDNAILINAARGGVVDEAALDRALEAGKIRGAALDVFEEEPVGEDHPLLRHDNFICTPHLGASTEEAQVNVAVQVAEQIADYLNKGTIQNAVNIPSVAEEEMPLLQPYLNLGERLGSILGQLAAGGLKKVDIEYAGEVSGLNQKPITTTILKGVLDPILPDSVNLVNAPLLAEQRDIKVSETTRKQAEEFTSMVRVTLTTEKRAWTIDGTLVHGTPRVVELNGVELELVPDGRLLYMANRDEPGLIGRIGTTLGNAGINIAGFMLGREAPHQQAVSFISVDQSVPADVLKQIASEENVLEVKEVNL
ncbi:3-phosphoglycerate dehydrogenase [Thiohalorhabdus denitrificans]|uniref:D-3-phosphoglycerate dehydrogenase n=1 Tax=Thiohalorhabdus denitrificans TaxID=381306 RepID=A0A0N8PN03_9GAMM|nr:phosphoglycerate dehydrogenase [Thiohalorhabdus denitrificans]KPV40165.1 3-phosphoglycerate dehydrogenase [Thiohalorhabdus denitrificans]SCY18293.1 D-3-phosphoglycerate dehydrogenase [Thiohalorhabdus denitrificans]